MAGLFEIIVKPDWAVKLMVLVHRTFSDLLQPADKNGSIKLTPQRDTHVKFITSSRIFQTHPIKPPILFSLPTASPRTDIAGPYSSQNYIQIPNVYGI
jgi:hypothetical protein